MYDKINIRKGMLYMERLQKVIAEAGYTSRRKLKCSSWRIYA